MSEAVSSRRRVIRIGGLIGGPVLALVLYLLLPRTFIEAGTGQPIAFSHAGRITLAIMAWMAVWWLTEAVEIAVTALLPIVLFPILGAADIKAATAPYADNVIFLFMGGFMLALSMQRWGLDRRIALITLRIVGSKPANMVGGFMIATAMLSAFVSNTATAAMMMPIALSVVGLVARGGGAGEDGGARSRDQSPHPGPLPGGEGVKSPPPRPLSQGERGEGNFALCLMLGIAYAASIGGIATIIGTPPNVFLVSFIREGITPEYQLDISFIGWMKIGLPLVIVFLPLVWLLLTRVIYPIRIREIEGGRALIEAEHRRLGPTTAGEWVTFIVFCCTAMLWMTRPLLTKIEVPLHDLVLRPFVGLSDAGIAMLGALMLFVIPVLVKRPSPEGRAPSPPTPLPAGVGSRWQFVMNWETARKLPWGILILFGGGLSLAAAVSANGVADFFGAQAARFAGAPEIVLILVIAAAVIFLTELTSNTATTATLVPLLAALAPGLGMHPYLLIIPAAVAASCAFMMPVATPPNAIVFGSGHVTIPQMCKAGLWLNCIGIVLVTLLTWLLVKPVLGVG